MGISKEDRISELKKVSLPKSLFKLATGETVPALLTDHCRTLKYYYESDTSLPNFSFVPLWEGHSSVTAYKLNNDATEFFKFQIEKPEDVEYLGSSINAVICDLFSWLWTEEEIENDELIKLAKELDFPCIDKFLVEIEIANEELIEPQGNWEKRFRETL